LLIATRPIRQRAGVDQFYGIEIKWPLRLAFVAARDKRALLLQSVREFCCATLTIAALLEALYAPLSSA